MPAPGTMALPRFYCPGPISTDEIVALPGSAAHHASRVLRLQPALDWFYLMETAENSRGSSKGSIGMAPRL